MWLIFSAAAHRLFVQSESSLGLMLLAGLALVVAALLLLLKPRGAAMDAGAGSVVAADAQRPKALPSACGIKLREDPFFQRLPRGLNEWNAPNTNDFPNYAHVQGVLHRGDERDFVITSPEEPYFFENEFCSALWLPMFRPTADKHLDAEGEWPYFNHFNGRKRKWEQRIRLKFKVPVDASSLRFAIQLRRYFPLGVVSKRSMKIVIAGLRQVAGQDLYYSPGEPSKKGQETELPTFAFPLWTFDQVIETPEGEMPPVLTDPNFHEYGIKRADNLAAFVQHMSQLELKPGPTFTFSLWGVSQFCDTVNWRLSGVLPFSIDYDAFAPGPPVTASLYMLRPGYLTEDDQRHLESRKDCLFRVDFWSSKKPPPRDVIAGLFPAMDEAKAPVVDSKKRRSWTRGLACCSVQGRHSD